MTNNELKAKYESLLANIDCLSDYWDIGEGHKLHRIFENYLDLLPEQDNPFQFSEFEVDIVMAKTEPKLKSQRNMHAKKYFNAKQSLKLYIGMSINEIPSDDDINEE